MRCTSPCHMAYTEITSWGETQQQRLHGSYEEAAETRHYNCIVHPHSVTADFVDLLSGDHAATSLHAETNSPQETIKPYRRDLDLLLYC